MTERSGPLSRFRVLDLTRARAGPTAARMIADWGADTIKIEQPPALSETALGGPRDGFDFQNLHRNKRSVTLNLKEPRGRELFLELAREADVVLENYRPGVKHRLGIDYETVRAANPRIVYGSISGFGQTGPYARRAGLDQIAQGLGGLMSVTGMPENGPVRVGIPVADLTAGINLAYGVLLALLEREASGEGQWVHTSLLEAQIMMMDLQAARYLIAGEVPVQEGNNHPTTRRRDLPDLRRPDQHPVLARPPLQAHVRHDGRAGDLREPGLRHQRKPHRAARGDQRRDRRLHAPEIDRPLGRGLRRRRRALRADPRHGRGFRRPAVETLNMDPAVEHARLGRLRMVGQAVKLARTPQKMHAATPDLGQHTEEVLAGIGVSAAEAGELRAAGVI